MCPAQLLLLFSGEPEKMPHPWPVLPHMPLTTLAASAAVCFLTSRSLPTQPSGPLLVPK